jgi:hypothetical protein
VTSTLLPGLAALIGTLAGVAATYVVARRRSSGRIATSESIRHDLTEDVKALRLEVATLRTENIALRAELAAIRQRMGD